jgi:hypothetical protein
MFSSIWCVVADRAGHRRAKVVHPWIAARPGISVSVDQPPFVVLPTVDLRNAECHRLDRAAADGRRGPFVADDVGQVPAHACGNELEPDRRAIGIHGRYAAEGGPLPPDFVAAPLRAPMGETATPVIGPGCVGLSDRRSIVAQFTKRPGVR